MSVVVPNLSYLRSTIHHPLSTIHHPPSTISFQLSAFSCLSVGVNERGCAQPQLSEVNYPPSTIHCPLSTIHCPLSTIHYPPSIVYWLCKSVMTSGCICWV